MSEKNIDLQKEGAQGLPNASPSMHEDWHIPSEEDINNFELLEHERQQVLQLMEAASDPIRAAQLKRLFIINTMARCVSL